MLRPLGFLLFRGCDTFRGKAAEPIAWGMRFQLPKPMKPQHLQLSHGSMTLIVPLFSTSFSAARHESQDRPVIPKSRKPTMIHSQQKAKDNPFAAFAGPKKPEILSNYCQALASEY